MSIPTRLYDAPTTPPSSGSSRSQSPFLHQPKFKTLKEKVLERCQSMDPFFSFEFFPPRTAGGAMNLLSRMERMSQGLPLFCDITWHVAGNPSSDEPTSSMTFATAMADHLGLYTMLHITCCNQSRAQIDKNLNRAKEQGISSLLILRGDPPKGEEWSSPAEDGFSYATQFVKHVRENYPDSFTIAVAGYPGGHPECKSYEEDLHYLKVKVDAGADFIITQLFFEVDVFLTFVRDCREIGITCPIIPGILPIQGYQSLKHITKLGGIAVPADILEVVEKIKDNDEAVRKFGIDLGTDMCKAILNSKLSCGLHFYTLNREVASLSILKNVGLWDEDPVKTLPWKPTANCTRFQEDVRPIFWATRPKSYVVRTSEWEEFPNGRWGNSSAATFGELDHHIFYLRAIKSKEERLSMWGRTLNGEEDVWSVFQSFITGALNKEGIEVLCIPWNEEKVAAETKLITTELAELNRRGVLTVNSQPSANGVPSTHNILGWGIPGGYVYQKAYLEFFVSAKRAMALKEIIHKYEPRVNYHIINSKGDDDYTNCDSYQPIAVTWGVFPGKEIAQPTVVDPIAFTFWKDEAFSLWHEHWGNLYPPNSTSRKVIDHIVSNYYLVNLVDNNFPEPSCLWQVCEEMLEKAAERKTPAPLSPRIKSPRKPDTTDIQYDQWPEKVKRLDESSRLLKL